MVKHWLLKEKKAYEMNKSKLMKKKIQDKRSN